MNKEQGSVLIQVITTAAISLTLVSSITLMLRNYTQKTEVNRFIKNRNTVGTRVGSLLLIPDVLLSSAEDLPEQASFESHPLYGNYMLRQCLGLAASEANTYRNENDSTLHEGSLPSSRDGADLIARDETCLLRLTGTARADDAWYPLLLIGTESYQDRGGSGCSFGGEGKWDGALSCFLAGKTNGASPDKQVAFSFEGEPSSPDKSHPLLSHVYFRPLCDDEGLEESCYRAKKIRLRYEITHVFDSDELADCAEERCAKNSPIQLGTYPKEEDYFVEITPTDILGNQCNEHARLQVLEDGGVQCQCIAPYQQALKEKGGELFYEENHKGPVCELINPMCQDNERLVGQTPEGIPICERVREEVYDGISSQENYYEFTKTFLSLDSPLYTEKSSERYTTDICENEESDEEGVCAFYSCRYHDKNEDGILRESERVDGWLANLDINCQSYLKFVPVNTHEQFGSVSYFEELVWNITETTAAVILTLSENALWIPRLLKDYTDVENPDDYSAYKRRDLLFPNVGEKLIHDTNPVTIFDREDLNIPFCNAEKILADNAPSGAPTTNKPRCPLVVCEYTMTCQYAAGNRSY